ncbi:hypothetical protein EHZ86_09340 [Aeromonas australiensis]|uniref:hypothetical protein n=1 Tax=Aeromonas australiensis TaxID=1114880 RepID=UPI001F366C0C|nr:hypothetical protein [Aeromonas australiensis]MCF3097513.1 hypothetical protein [Aeromonas australiensis]
MKPPELALLVLMVALARAQLEEWQLNREDAILLAGRGVPTVSLWQCGSLKQRIAALNQHSAEVQFQYRGQNMADVIHYLEREWKQAGCEQLLVQQGY